MNPLNDFAAWSGLATLAGLVLTAILVAYAGTRSTSRQDWSVMPLSFVVNFASLLLVGPTLTLAVIAAGAAVELWTSGRSYLRVLRDAASASVGVQIAGIALGAVSGIVGGAWPLHGVAVGAAVLSYCLVKTATEEVLVPLSTKRSIDSTWPATLLQACTGHLVGASIAAGLAELATHQMWAVLPLVAVPIYCAYRIYNAYLDRLDHDELGQHVIESVDRGMTVQDVNGRLILWNAAIARILECPRERALGRTLTLAIPALGKTDLPKAIRDTLASRTARTLTIALPSGADERILEVRIVAAGGGATLLWEDITERVCEETAIRRSGERLELAAEGAVDGLWEWDLRSEEFYCSSRWKAIIGLPATAGGSLREWMDRVHSEDVGPLREALEAHLSGKTDIFQHEHRIRHEDGAYRRVLSRGLAARVAGQRPSHVAGSMSDLTERASAQSGQAGNMVLRDALTGLANRAVFVDRLGDRLDELKSNGRSRFAALYLDLDRFKIVNDSLGHLVGDELLTAVSRRLEACLRPGDSLARLGGDEFAILLNDLDDETQANAISFRIQKTLSEPFSIGGREVFTSASIGIAFGRPVYTNPEEIMRDADTAMYHAKSRGKARHELFDADMHAREQDRVGFENDLRHAVDHNDFEVLYQPIVSLSSGMCVGFESLVRWNRNGTAVSPATFIPIAEELGLVEPLGTWVLEKACTTFADWKRRYPLHVLDCITVNVSSRQLMQQNFLWIVQQAVQNSGLRPADLRLEITETALMDSPTVAAELLKRLRDFGVKIYLDDFGTGYSSLSHLHKLPVDALKIDRSFVRSLLLPDRPAIVESILALARTLNTSVVAEGIESDVQATELERLGCTHAQGYLFSRPISALSVEEILKASEPLGPKGLVAAVEWRELQRIVALPR